MRHLPFCHRRTARILGTALMLFVSGFIGYGTAQTITPKQLAAMAKNVASRGMTDILAIHYLYHENLSIMDVVVVGEAGDNGWRIVVFQAKDQVKPIHLKWDSGNLPNYFGPASTDDVSIRQLANGESVLVFEACAAHSCPIDVFGIALYSPWTGRGYFAYSAGNDIKYDHTEPGIYYDELAKLVQARKTHWDLKGPRKHE